MKKLLPLFLFLSFCATLHAQHSSEDLNYENCKEFLGYDRIDSSVYNITVAELKELIKCKQKEYTLVYVYAIWCAPCIKKLPKKIGLIKYKDSLDVMFLSIEKDHTQNLAAFRDYFESINYNYPLFVINEDYAKGSKKKYRLFLDDLIPGYEMDGLGKLILFDSKAEILLISDYRMKNEVGKVRKIIGFPNQTN